MKSTIYKSDLLYPELSYQVVGILFDIFTELGYGYRENQYQKAVEMALKSIKLGYEKELPVKISYKGEFVTTVCLDFLIDSKIVLELKQGNRFNKKDIEQVYNYLKVTKLKLGILARFTKSGVKFMRVVNIDK